MMGGSKARNKGHAYERTVAIRWREHGFKDTKTSRLVSKFTDDMGIDLVGTDPFSVQCKAVEKLSPGYHQILSGMPFGNINLIFHKRNRLGSVVVMSEEDFFLLLEHLNIKSLNLQRDGRGKPNRKSKQK